MERVWCKRGDKLYGQGVRQRQQARNIIKRLIKGGNASLLYSAGWYRILLSQERSLQQSVTIRQALVYGYDLKYTEGHRQKGKKL